MALEGKGLSWRLGAYVVGAAATADGRYFAVGMGDGAVGVLDLTNAAAGFKTVEAHKGSALAFCADISGGAFLTGGDDGKLVSTTLDGTRTTIAEVGKKWIEHVDAHAATGFRVYAAGKDAFILGKKDKEPRAVTHSSTVGGVAINPKGRRVAVSHYGGVSLWWLAAKDGRADFLPWKGSHLQIAWSPDSNYVVTAMQENSLHGWRLSDAQHFRMQGYAAKIRAMSFHRRGLYLATGGADSVISWPFTGGGPMGKAPAEFGGALNGRPVTCVLASPKLDAVAAGFEDGRVIVGQPGVAQIITIAKPAKDKEGAAITALAWTPDSERLLAGSEAGDVHVADFRIMSGI